MTVAIGFFILALVYCVCNVRRHGAGETFEEISSNKHAIRYTVTKGSVVKHRTHYWGVPFCAGRSTREIEWANEKHGRKMP